KKEDMKKRGLPSPDDWDALVLCFAQPNFPGAGILNFYAQEAAKLKTAAEQRGNPKQPNGTIRLLAPEGVSTVYAMSGASYPVGLDRIVCVALEDAKPLYAHGYIDAQE